MVQKRRLADIEPIPAHTRRQLGELTEEERISLVDALHVALSGWKRRAGDERRWRSLLERLGAKP